MTEEPNITPSTTESSAPTQIPLSSSSSSMRGHRRGVEAVRPSLPTTLDEAKDKMTLLTLAPTPLTTIIDDSVTSSSVTGTTPRPSVSMFGGDVGTTGGAEDLAVHTFRLSLNIMVLVHHHYCMSSTLTASHRRSMRSMLMRTVQVLGDQAGWTNDVVHMLQLFLGSLMTRLVRSLPSFRHEWNHQAWDNVFQILSVIKKLLFYSVRTFHTFAVMADGSRSKIAVPTPNMLVMIEKKKDGMGDATKPTTTSTTGGGGGTTSRSQSSAGTPNDNDGHVVPGSVGADRVRLSTINDDAELSAADAVVVPKELVERIVAMLASLKLDSVDQAVLYGLSTQEQKNAIGYTQFHTIP
jgi:hypothetical protein